MRDFKRSVMGPVIIGVLALLIQALDQWLSPIMQPAGNNGFAWIAFLSWAVYFLAGSSIKGGVKAFLGFAVGIGASILIIMLGGVLTPILSFWGVPIALGFIAFMLIFLEKVEWLNLIPAIFIGAGIFFAYMTYVSDATFSNAVITEIIYCVIGIIFGYFTVTLRTAFEKR